MKTDYVLNMIKLYYS